MMKRIFLELVFLLSVVIGKGQTLRDMWVSMPDTLVPYLDKSMRLSLIDYYDISSKADIKNALDGTSRLDSLSTDYLSAKLNDSATLQIALLPTSDGDTLACVIKTFYTPEADSDVSIYTRSWQLKEQIKMPADSLYSRPDTMATEHFEQLKGLISPELVGATISSNEEGRTLTFCLSIPFIYKDEEDAMKSILKQINLKWNGKRFKECY